jgi:hypothetical protein
VRPALADRFALGDDGRLREEAPFTGHAIQLAEGGLTSVSRYQATLRVRG